MILQKIKYLIKYRHCSGFMCGDCVGDGVCPEQKEKESNIYYLKKFEVEGE